MKRMLAALAAALSLGAAGASPPPAERFFQPPRLIDVQLSPSGQRMALTAQAGNGRIGLFVIDLQASDFKANSAALFSDVDVNSIDWVDDERLVFGAVDLQAGRGEDYEVTPGLYAVRHDGEQLRQLIDRRGRPRVTGGERAKALHFNHRLLHVPLPSEERGGARADEVIVGELRGSGNELTEVLPMWLNTRTGRTRWLEMHKAPDGAVRWWFSPLSEPRAVLTVEKGRETLHGYVAPRESGQPGQWRVLADGPLGQLALQPRWVGQDDTLYVQHAGGARGETVLAPFDMATRKPGPALVVAPGFDFNGQVIGDREGRRLLGVRIDTDAEQTIWFDTARKALQAMVDEALPGRVNRLQCRRCDAEDAVLLVRSYSDRDPGQLLLWRKADNGGQGRWQRVGFVRPGINPAEMASTDFHRLKARDGRDLPVWITRGAEAKAAQPAVVLVHGGPWVRGRHWRWEALPQYLASRGYLVIEPEFRGSAGYGGEHLRAGFKQWGQAMQDDVADALLWAQKQGLASEAACIVGASYGGYSTLMGLIRHPELYRCGSAWVAVTDPFLFLEGSWRVRDDVSSSGRRYSLPRMVGDVEKDRDMLLANSPLARAAEIRRPLQLVWGSEDRRVPIQHGERLREAMRQAGQEPEWLVFDGEAHGWRKTEHWLAFAQQLDAFLARHLKP